MSVTAAQVAATPAQAPTCETKNEEPLKGKEDLLVAAYRLRAIGCTEQAAVLVLDTIRRDGVRRVGRYVRRLSGTQLHKVVRRVERDATRAAHSTARGDLIVLRSDPRWPWRVSTA